MENLVHQILLDSINLPDLISYPKVPILFCQTCKKVPIIKGINLNLKEAFISCKCRQIKIINFFQFYYNLTRDFSKFEVEEYNKCNFHNEKYRYYCENCELHFCEKSSLFHKCNIKYLIDFENLKYGIEKKINYINKYLLNLDDNIDHYFIKKIISIILNQYKIYPNYNIIKNINNIYLAFLNNKEFSNEEVNVNMEAHEIFDLDFSNNQLDNIDFILIKDLRNLKVLNLHNNKLSNVLINHLKQLNCHDLSILNLSSNFFTDYLLLTVGENYLLLKELNLDTNRLYENYDTLKNKLIVYDSLEKLILSNGIFSKETINLLGCFKFKNLKYLDLNSNDLKSLSFIKLNFGKDENKIEKLISYNNEISISDEDIDYLLSHYLNLKLLVLEEEEIYSIAYKRRKNLPFTILCFDNNKTSEYLLEQYEKKEKENEGDSESLIEYQQYYDNADYK